MSREIADQVFSPKDFAYIWTNNYIPVFPFTMQDFRIGALLPVILYMLRWGHRRGKGHFFQKFAPDGGGKPTVESVATILADEPDFEGFAGSAGKAMLGDLLLSFLIENKKKSPVHTEQIQRVLSSHYFSSWIDLPQNVANLRGVPEFIVAVLAWQREEQQIVRGDRRHKVKVGAALNDNRVLRMFSPGVFTVGDYLSNLTSDRFDERASIGIDQLLAVRLGLTCGAAPEKARGKGEASPILNQRPLSIRAAEHCHEDLVTFILAYGETMPRAAFVGMLESGIGINLFCDNQVDR